ncbi:MAG TPA: hypothetical protein VIT22_06470 [Pseudoxanthomonas sp.]
MVLIGTRRLDFLYLAADDCIGTGYMILGSDNSSIQELCIPIGIRMVCHQTVEITETFVSLDPVSIWGSKLE